MAAITGYSTSSPYLLTTVFDGIYLDVMVNRPIPQLEDDVLWTVTEVYQYRPDLLASDLYNNSGLWWVFAQRNPNVLQDPLFDLKTGTKIYLPKLSTLQGVLGV